LIGRESLKHCTVLLRLERTRAGLIFSATSHFIENTSTRQPARPAPEVFESPQEVDRALKEAERGELYNVGFLIDYRA